MKKNTLLNRVDARLAACAAVAVAGTAISATQAEASVVYSGAVNITVPNTFGGVYLNLVTGATGTSGSSVPGYDFDPYGSGGFLAFYFPTGSGGLTQGGAYAVLMAGDTVSSMSTFLGSAHSDAATMGNYQAGTNGYLGLQFLNDTTGVTNYGYIHFSTTGTTGFPATILDYAYENSGGAITVVPEPSTFALLGLMGAGAMGVRAWRKRKAA